jgi:hypothetical protein
VTRCRAKGSSQRPRVQPTDHEARTISRRALPPYSGDEPPFQIRRFFGGSWTTGRNQTDGRLCDCTGTSASVDWLTSHLTRASPEVAGVRSCSSSSRAASGLSATTLHSRLHGWSCQSTAWRRCRSVPALATAVSAETLPLTGNEHSPGSACDQPAVTGSRCSPPGKREWCGRIRPGYVAAERRGRGPGR